MSLGPSPLVSKWPTAPLGQTVDPQHRAHCQGDHYLQGGLYLSSVMVGEGVPRSEIVQGFFWIGHVSPIIEIQGKSRHVASQNGGCARTPSQDGSSCLRFQPGKGGRNNGERRKDAENPSPHLRLSKGFWLLPENGPSPSLSGCRGQSRPDCFLRKIGNQRWRTSLVEAAALVNVQLGGKILDDLAADNPP